MPIPIPSSSSNEYLVEGNAFVLVLHGCLEGHSSTFLLEGRKARVLRKHGLIITNMEISL